MKIRFLPNILVWIAMLGMTFTVKSQSTQMEFGQNRVQFHEFYWSYYESENFVTYYYPGGQDLGRFSVKVAEDLLMEVEDFLDYRINRKFDLLVYNDITDFGMTNIGIGREIYNTGGTTQILENKLFVYFDGDHQNMYHSIRKGIATVLIDAMMFGGNFVEVLQNAVLLNLPEWYKSGLASFIGDEWNVEMDNALRKYFLSGKTPDFNQFTLDHPELAGHSMWYFISSNFGREIITEILYLTRVNRNASDGFLFAVGSNLFELENMWKEYFLDRYVKDMQRTQIDSIGENVRLKVRINGAPSQVKISPDGKHLVYASQDDGAYKVFLLDRETNKVKKLLKAGMKSDSYPHDASYPLISWSPTGSRLLVLYEKRDVIQLFTYEMENGEKATQDMKGFQRISSVEFIGPKTVVMSAQKAGQTDIFTHYLPSERTIQITRDFYDDLDATGFTHNGKKGILFSSNRHVDTLKRMRPDTILPVGNFDLFFYDLENKNPALARLTNTPFSDERKAQQIGENKYAYISEENGIRNIVEGFMDTTILEPAQILYIDGEAYAPESVADSVEVDSTVLVERFKVIGINRQLTDLTFNIDEWDVALKKRETVVVTDKPKARRAKWYASVVPNSKLDQAKKSVTAYKRQWEVANADLLSFLQDEDHPDAEVEPDYGADTIYLGEFPYTFQNKYNHILQPVPDNQATSNIFVKGNDIIKTANSDIQFIGSRVVPYRAKFTSDIVVAQLDNSLNVTGYDNFNLNGGVFNYPDLNAMITYGLTDIMEDHRLVAGFMIPVDFDGTTVYVSYNNLKRRFDWRLLFYRETDKEVFAWPEGLFLNPPNIPGQLPLPADIDLPDLIPNASGFISVNPQLGLSGKLKTHFVEASIKYPIDIMNSVRLHAGYRNERIILQSLDTVGLAFPTYQENWLQFKLEFVHDNSKEIATNIRNGFRFKVWTEYHKNLNERNTNIFVTAFDLRHYQKVYKNIIWANRIAYGASYGDQKIIYYLGGVDTWLNPKFDNSVPIDFSQNYAFQAAAVNMRGFPQNVRNGNSFLLINSELRVPIFAALAKRPIKMAFIRDFQIVAFADAGMAYKGLVPWDDENAFNIETIGDETVTPVTVEVNYYRRPTVFGVGTGFRTSLLGYFFRLDVGWGLDGSDAKKKPVWHVSFSKDF